MHHLKRKVNKMNANESYLNTHLANEERAEIRAERVKELAKSYMQDGEDYYPFQPDNLGEALAEMNHANLKFIAAAFAVAAKDGFMNDMANHLAVIAIAKNAELYWEDYAMTRAEKEMDND